MSRPVQSNHEPTTDITTQHEQTPSGLDKTTVKTQTGDVAVIIIADPNAPSSAVQEATSQAGIQHLMKRNNGGDA